MTDRPVLSPDENDERISDRIPFPLMNKSNPWDEYSIVRKLGRGSFGHVYEAVHKPTRHVVAVKQIALESSDSDNESHMQDLEEIQIHALGNYGTHGRRLVFITFKTSWSIT